MYATTELRPLLAERGVVLSREQVYRLVVRTPERLSLATLAALCDIWAAGPVTWSSRSPRRQAARPAAGAGAAAAAAPGAGAARRGRSAVARRPLPGRPRAAGRQRRGCPACRRDQVVGLVAAAEGSLPRPVVAAAVDAVAHRPGRRCGTWQRRWPPTRGALRHGAPPVAGRLAAELIARGSATLAAPACARCGRAGRPLTRSDGGGVMRSAAPARQLAAACAPAGGQAGRLPRQRRAPLCERCRRAWPRPPPVRDLRQDRPDRGARPAAAQPDICVNCYRMPEAVCACAAGAGSATSPPPAARSARHARPGPPPHARAAGRTARPRPAGPKGRSATRATPPRCGTAGDARPAASSGGWSPRPARPLTPAPTAPGCRSRTPALTAGSRTSSTRRGRCDRCSLRRRARRCCRRARGTSRPGWRRCSRRSARPATREVALNWLRRGAGAALLADVAAGPAPATHEALDAHPRRRAADYLRHMLTAGGVAAAPGRGTRPHRAMAGRHARGHQPPAAPAAGAVLRHLAGNAAAARQRRPRAPGPAPTPPTPAQHPRRRGLPGLAGRPRAAPWPPAARPTSTTGSPPGPAACQVRDFLTWAARHGHCPAFAIPGPGAPHGTATSQDQRWALAARLLHDDSLDLTDRAAGCLLLLYGQQLSRIAAMTTSQVTSRDDTVFVRFGEHDVPVPEPLGVILTELIHNGRTHTGTGSPAGTPWLFPGGLPGQPDHRSPARRAPARPRHLRHDRPPGRAHRSRRPAARRRPRRPARTSPRAPRSAGRTRPEATGPATRPN